MSISFQGIPIVLNYKKLQLLQGAFLHFKLIHLCKQYFRAIQKYLPLIFSANHLAKPRSSRTGMVWDGMVPGRNFSLSSGPRKEKLENQGPT